MGNLKSQSATSSCPYFEGEIAVFSSWCRFETYVARVERWHVEEWGCASIPAMRKATLEEKQDWYECDVDELVIAEAQRFELIHLN